MPQFNLTNPQREIIVTWLYEPYGYLESQVNDQGVSAFEALQADPNLDVTQWIRDNTPGPGVNLEGWTDTAMVWWILVNDQVNIPVPQRPPEAAEWAAKLHKWDDSINAGFARTPQNERDSNSVQLYDENQQPSGTFPSGGHLAQQQQIITKVLGVLE